MVWLGIWNVVAIEREILRRCAPQDDDQRRVFVWAGLQPMADFSGGLRVLRNTWLSFYKTSHPSEERRMGAPYAVIVDR
jgi:hypothetical protein